ncbi:MAG: TolC family protein, partial [Bacteroidota bacterium]
MKNKHKRLFTALFLLLLFISSGISQELFTLQELAEKTLQENYQIRIARKEASIEKNNNTLGNAGFLPTLSLNAEQGFSREDSRSNFYTGASRVGQGARQTSGQAFIELDWIIFDGLKMFARRDKLSHFEQSEILTVKYYIEQTIADLAKAYFYLKKEHEKLKKYQQTLSVSKYRLKLEKQRETIGSGNSLLYQQALVDLLADSAKVIDQQSTINNIQVQINQVINRDLDAPILPSSEDIILEEKKQNKDSLIQKVLQSNIELKKAQLNQLI